MEETQIMDSLPKLIPVISMIVLVIIRAVRPLLPSKIASKKFMPLNVLVLCVATSFAMLGISVDAALTGISVAGMSSGLKSWFKPYVNK